MDEVKKMFFVDVSEIFLKHVLFYLQFFENRYHHISYSCEYRDLSPQFFLTYIKILTVILKHVQRS